MSAQPKWEDVDQPLADKLELVATGPLAPPSADPEWDEFTRCLRYVASQHDGIVSPNDMRELVRGVVAHKRIGAFYSRASAQDLIRATGEWAISTDTEGGNAGRPVRTYRYTGPTA